MLQQYPLCKTSKAPCEYGQYEQTPVKLPVLSETRNVSPSKAIYSSSRSWEHLCMVFCFLLKIVDETI